jgi:hypothetical protein
MKNNKIIYMTDKGHAMLDKFPDLKARLPLVQGGLTVISMAFVKSLQDAEFVCFAGLPCDFRVDEKTLQYIQDRMLDLGIEHQKSTKEKAISTKSQILSTKN